MAKTISLSQKPAEKKHAYKFSLANRSPFEPYGACSDPATKGKDGEDGE